MFIAVQCWIMLISGLKTLLWCFFWLNQLTWRHKQFLLRCFGLLRSVCWSDGAFRIVCGHPCMHQYKYLVFLVVTSDKFFCLPLWRPACFWGQDLPCSVLWPQAFCLGIVWVAWRELVVDRAFAKSVGWPGERCFWTHKREFLSKTYINTYETELVDCTGTMWICSSVW